MPINIVLNRYNNILKEVSLAKMTINSVTMNKVTIKIMNGRIRRKKSRNKLIPKKMGNLREEKNSQKMMIKNSLEN